MTVAAPNFSVPPVPSDNQCSSLLAPSVNEQLAGSGHSLSLTLRGDVELPPAPGETSLTTLSASPESGSTLGDDVTLTAVVAPGEGAEATETPTGFVDFRDGGTVVGTAALIDGEAAFTTDALPAGTRTLTARYRGDSVYSFSLSAPVAYRVNATPAITATPPPSVQIGGGPVDFDVTVTNTGFGADLADARLDLRLQRAAGNGAIDQDRITVQLVDGDSTVPVTLTTTATFPTQVRSGFLPPEAGEALAPGQSRTYTLRLELGPDGSPALLPGPLLMAFDVVTVDPETGEASAPFASDDGVILMTEAQRRPTAVTSGRQVPGFPQLDEPAVAPHTVRQGNNVRLSIVNLTGAVGGVNPLLPATGGALRVEVDGRPVDILAIRTQEWVPELSGTTGNIGVRLPPDLTVGEHQLTIKYTGNAFYLPSQVSYPFTVVPSAGPAYDCRIDSAVLGLISRFNANVVVAANLPGSHPVGDLALSGLDIELRPDNEAAMVSNLTGGLTPDETVVGDGQVREVIFELGPAGTGTATTVTRSGSAQPLTPYPAPMSAVDQVVGFGGERATVAIDGAPGDVVPITLTSIRINTIPPGLPVPYDYTCIPVGDPITVGEVVVAGTTLEVDPAERVREGAAVTLNARTAPATPTGIIEFRDGDTTIGVVPVDGEGNASMVTSTLPEGTRSLTARSFGGLLVPSTVSPVVGLTVVGTQCPEFAQEGNGAVVRLVFLELLGRCPDPGGYASWVDRLDDGMSREAFANTIARTNEALGRVVDDGYSTMLDRAPDPGGRTFWIGRLGSTGRYDQLLADLASSNEFWTEAGSTNDGFVTLVYERILGRAPDPGGLVHWTGRLNAGVPRGTLVSTLARLDEPLGRIVDGSYAQILSRAPSGPERTSAIAALRATGNRSALYAALIGTSEFFDRAQSFPNPED